MISANSVILPSIITVFENTVIEQLSTKAHITCSRIDVHVLRDTISISKKYDMGKVYNGSMVKHSTLLDIPPALCVLGF